MSWADCQRSAGSLARHALTSRSKAGGLSGWSEETGGGSEFRIDAMSPAWLEPEKALRPAAIS